MSTSIRQKITLFTLLPAVIFYSLISAIYIYFSFHSATSEISRRHLEQSLHYASVIDGSLREIMTGSKALSVDLKYWSSGKSHLFVDSLNTLFANNRVVTGVGIISEEGEQFSEYWEHAQTGFVRTSDTENVPPVSQLLVRELMYGGRKQSEWYTSANPEDLKVFASTYVIPVETGLGKKMLLRVDINAARLREPMQWYNPNTRLIILNEEGVVVYANGISMPKFRLLEYFVHHGPCEGNSKLNVTHSSSGQQISEFLFSPIRPSSITEPCLLYREALERVTLRGQSVNFRVQVRGEKKWVTATPIPSTGWYMSIGIHESELLGPVIEHGVISIGVVLLMLILTIFCLWTVSGRITRPLNRLKLQMNEVADSYGSPVDDDSRDEAASLNRSFSQLLERLRDRELSLHQARASNIGHLVQQLRGRYFYFNLDQKGGILHVSPSITAVLGYRDQEFTGNLQGYLTPSLLNQPFNKVMKRLVGGEWQEAFEVEMRHRDGSIRLIELFCTTSDEFSDQGRIIEGMGNDITDRTRDTEKFKLLIASAPDATVITNEDGIISRINRKVSELFGFSESELINMPLALLIDSGSREGHPLLRHYSQELHNSFCLESYESKGMDRLGHAFPMEISSNVLDSADGIQISIVLRNVTERKKIETELVSAKVKAEHASRAKSMFLSNISHELRTPLNGVLGYAQLLLSDKNIPPRYLDNLRSLEDCGIHLMTLINDILDITKIESSGVELDAHPFDLRATLGTVIANVKEVARTKKLNLQLQVDEGIPLEVVGDNVKLRQVLINLVGNAVKFTETGFVKVLVTVPKENNARLQFSVRDSGVGIREDERERLFKPFTQLKSGQKQGGTGLGLAISYRLVKAMGGELVMESEQNRGSCFSFTIPFETANDRGANGESHTETIDYQSHSLLMQEGSKLLVVDDNADNRNMLSEALISEGLKVISVGDGQQSIEAVRKAGSEPFDLVLMDLKMPVMDGITATRRIHRLPGRESVNVIAVSASVSETTRETILEAGFCDFIAKPVRFDELFAKVSYWLSHSYQQTRDESSSEGISLERLEEMIEVIEQSMEVGDIEALKLRAENWQHITGYGDCPGQLVRLCRSLDVAGIEFVCEKLVRMKDGTD
ncbi:ATP-binding protein [Endozoicomonas arenosclerae]|uniref:ATP-binding protein n=1 Tax=Endozoicomonas arenosclerae TaxID=1633495 RepID=UPI000780E55D|nr:ATP-binding protein [Endozoicomonas arenosclerae]